MYVVVDFMCNKYERLKEMNTHIRRSRKGGYTDETQQDVEEHARQEAQCPRQARIEAHELQLLEEEEDEGQVDERDDRHGEQRARYMHAESPDSIEPNEPHLAKQ